MLTAEQNRLITETGPETPCGALMRRYWQPAALVEELDLPASGQTRPPARRRSRAVPRSRPAATACCIATAPTAAPTWPSPAVRTAACAARSMAGCYDISGACLEQPAEPAGSTFHLKVRQPAYPCVERAGIIWAYLGPGEPPPFPSFDCFVAPDSHVFAFKGLWSCNWLQALEVGIDPAHASFLHRFFADEDPSDAAYGRQFRAATIGADIPMTRLMREVAQSSTGIRGNPVRPAHHHVAPDQRPGRAPAHHQHAVSARVRDPAEPRNDDHPVPRAGRRHALLLVCDLHQLRRAGRQSNDAGAAAGNPHAARLRAAREPRQRLGLQSGRTG